MEIVKRKLSYDFPFGKKTFEMYFNPSFSTQRIPYVETVAGDICDRNMFNALTFLLREGDVYIDIGANMGYVPVFASHYVGPRGRVICFEPSTTSYPTLCLNKIANTNAKFDVYNWAVSDVDGILAFYVNQRNDGFSSTFAESAAFRDDTVVECRVQAYCLDTLLDKGIVCPARVLKIDVEGAEANVFKGGTRYFSSGLADAVVFEFNYQTTSAEKNIDLEIRKVLTGYGYEHYFCVPHDKIVRVLKNGKIEVYRTDAFLCKISDDVEMIPESYGNIMSIKPAVSSGLPFPAV